MIQGSRRIIQKFEQFAGKISSILLFLFATIYRQIYFYRLVNGFYERLIIGDVTLDWLRKL